MPCPLSTGTLLTGPCSLSPLYSPPPQWHLVSKTRDLFKLVHFRISPLPVLTSGSWLLKHVRWVSSRHASYWNAFFFSFEVEDSRITCQWWKETIDIKGRRFLSVSCALRQEDLKQQNRYQPGDFLLSRRGHFLNMNIDWPLKPDMLQEAPFKSCNAVFGSVKPCCYCKVLNNWISCSWHICQKIHVA